MVAQVVELDYEILYRKGNKDADDLSCRSSVVGAGICRALTSKLTSKVKEKWREEPQIQESVKEVKACRGHN